MLLTSNPNNKTQPLRFDIDQPPLTDQINTWNPSLRATSMILFRVIPGKIVPFIAGVEIVLPYVNMQNEFILAVK